MALTLESPWRTPERILVYGSQGTGKSEGILSVARRCPGATFHVIDSDVSESYNRALDTTYADLTNVAVHRVDPDDFMDQFHTAEKVATEVGPQDWFVVDSMTTPWPAVQSWFITQVHGLEEDDYFLEVRKAKKEANAKKGTPLAPFEGFMDWPVINKRYNRFTAIVFKVKGHLYLTAEAAKISDMDDRETKQLFGSDGVKPAGQKRLGYMPSTVLLAGKTRMGEYQLTTVKDRNRVELEHETIGDFATDYLVKVAGWKKRPMKAAE